MTFHVSLDALEHDAKLWKDVSGTLATAAGSARGLTLSAHEFTGVADRNGLVALYQQAQSTVATLVQEGSDEASRVASTLTGVREQYINDEASARAKLAGVWEPK